MGNRVNLHIRNQSSTFFPVRLILVMPDAYCYKYEISSVRFIHLNHVFLLATKTFFRRLQKLSDTCLLAPAIVFDLWPKGASRRVPPG